MLPWSLPLHLPLLHLEPMEDRPHQQPSKYFPTDTDCLIILLSPHLYSSDDDWLPSRFCSSAYTSWFLRYHYNSGTSSTDITFRTSLLHRIYHYWLYLTASFTLHIPMSTAITQYSIPVPTHPYTIVPCTPSVLRIAQRPADMINVERRGTIILEFDQTTRHD